MSTPPAPGGAGRPLRRIGPGLAGVMSLAAYVSLLLLPLFGVLVALLASLPLAHLRASGRPSILAWGWVAVALGAAAVVVQEAWLVAVLLGYLLVAVWPAVSVELWMRRAWSAGRWSALVALGAFVVTTAFVVALTWPSPPAESLVTMMAGGIDSAGSMLRAFGSRGSEELMVSALQIVSYLAPAGVTLYVLAAALWLRPRLAVLGLPRGEEAFDTYRSEEWLPVAFIIGGLGWVFATGLAQWVAANLFAVVVGLYFVHGLAVIFFYLGRRLAGNRWVRLLLALFAMQVPVALLFSAVGLADNFITLRRGGLADGGNHA